MIQSFNSHEVETRKISGIEAGSAAGIGTVVAASIFPVCSPIGIRVGRGSVVGGLVSWGAEYP